MGGDKPRCLPQWHSFTLPPTVHKGSDFSASSTTLMFCAFVSSHPNGREVKSGCSSDLYFLLIGGAEHLLMCILDIDIYISP